MFISKLSYDRLFFSNIIVLYDEGKVQIKDNAIEYGETIKAPLKYTNENNKLEQVWHIYCVLCKTWLKIPKG